MPKYDLFLDLSFLIVHSKHVSFMVKHLNEELKYHTIKAPHLNWPKVITNMILLVYKNAYIMSYLVVLFWFYLKNREEHLP